MWYALVVFIPGKNMVVAVTANDGDIKAAESAAWKIVNASANQFNVEGDATRANSEPPETETTSNVLNGSRRTGRLGTPANGDSAISHRILRKLLCN
jgi:hypothetical protein